MGDEDGDILKETKGEKGTGSCKDESRVESREGSPLGHGTHREHTLVATIQGKRVILAFVEFWYSPRAISTGREPYLGGWSFCDRRMFSFRIWILYLTGRTVKGQMVMVRWK